MEGRRYQGCSCDRAGVRLGFRSEHPAAGRRQAGLQQDMGPAAHFGHHQGFQCLRQRRSHKGVRSERLGEIAYTAWGREQWTGPRFDYAARCLPWGYTRAMQTAYPIEIMQTPRRLAILFESNNVFHMVPTETAGEY